MRFLAFSPLAGLALLAIVATAIVLAYLLRQRRRRVVVASTLLWRQVATGARLRQERWRWWLSLALALAIGLGIALALTRPEVAALAGTARRVVLVMDNAPSMAARTRDGASRWQHALTQARDVVASAGAASEFMVLDTMGQAAIPDFVGAGEALAQLAALSPAVTGRARMPFVPQPAPTDPPHDVLLLTDGVAALELPQGLDVRPVFEPAANLALTAFEARAQPHDPARVEAVAQVLNASTGARRATLELLGAGGFTVTRELDVPAGQSVVEVFDVSAFAGGTLTARVRLQDDAFPLDDEAYAVVAQRRTRKVLLVTAGNPRLEQALKLLPAVAVAVVKPDDYTAAASTDAGPDLYVFDSWAPRDAPRGSVLAFGPPNAPWLGGAAGDVAKPTITQWDRSHPLTQDVAWRDVRVKRGALADLAATVDRSALVLARGTREGALISAGGTSTRWIRVGFALADSNLPYQAGFPIFLRHAVDWLDPRPAPLARDVGTVELPWSDAAVSDAQRRPITVSRSDTATRFEATAPGVYTARQGGTDQLVVVNALDPRRAEINRSRFAGAVALAPAPPRPRAPSPVEPWLLLIAAAALLLVIEWVSFTRRWTV